MELTGKVAVVTGAGQGIGRASARLFASRGAAVVVVDVDDEKGRETVALIEKDAGDAAFIRVDVTRESDVARMIQFAASKFGGVDCAHNNAGGPLALPHRNVHETDETTWDALLDLNLKAAFLCMKHEVRHMLQQGRGAIVNTASIAGLRGSVSRPVYTAAKHGLIGLTRSAAIDYATSGIRINAVSPGVTLSERLTATRSRNEIASLVAKVPTGRGAEPYEVAEAAVWLCSDAASSITGAVLAVDGGMSAV